MAKITFLGTAASVSSRARDNTSLLFSADKKYVLIDCPGSIVHKLEKIGIDFRALKKVVITHPHIDHYYGLFHLIHAQSYLNKHITIYARRPTIRILKKLVSDMKLKKSHYPRITFDEVTFRRPFLRRHKITLRAIPNNHTEGSFGIQFSSGAKKVLYSCDTALSDSIISAAKRCDYLIHDCTASSRYFKKHPQLFRVHTNARDLAALVRKTRVKKLIPVHFLLLEKNEMRRIRGELIPLGKRVRIPSDFDRLIF